MPNRRAIIITRVITTWVIIMKFYNREDELALPLLSLDDIDEVLMWGKGKNMKKLPIGISSFEKIITENYVYIDKTRHVDQLVNKGAGRYFLSRPRRFGKS